ncbi:hypothetical protein D3C81_2073130 [compost metagenome]
MLALGVVVDHEQHVWVALGTPGEVGEHRHVVVPDRPRRDRSQQLGHIVGGVLEVLFQRAAQLLLLALQARRQTCAKALAGAAGEAVEA